MSDKTFLEKLNDRCIEHPHFDSRVKSRSDTTIDFECFQLRHYAGDVCSHLFIHCFLLVLRPLFLCYSYFIFYAY